MKPSFRYLAGLFTALFLLAVPGQVSLAAPVELSLDDSIALALKNNPEIKLADSARKKSLWAVRQAAAGMGPNLAFTHTDKRYDSFNTTKLYLYGIKQYEWSNKYDNLLTLSLPLYSGGKLDGQLDAARLGFKVADLGVAATRQQLTQTVTTYYFGVLQYRNSLQVSRQTVDNYVRHLKNVQLQFEAGVVAKSDVLASEVSLANAQVNLIKAQNSHVLAVANLNNAIGLPLDSELALKEDLKYTEYAQTLDECAKYALVNRPELAQYQAKVAIAGDDVKVARSGYLPQVNFSATQDWYDAEFPGNDNKTWSVGVAASFNVFDSGLTRSKVRQAQEGLATAREQAGQKRDAVLLEVRQYYLSMREAEKRIEASQVGVNQAEENLRIAELRYSAGVGTNLDVLDAVLSLNTAKLSNIQALYDYNTNKAQLNRAMGTPVK
ncbi:MAG TPA: TolC family protein [Negativicutes bacterium]|nr:TolC family protein [Negativicutes bacterium]